MEPNVEKGYVVPGNEKGLSPDSRRKSIGWDWVFLEYT
jgi:hypothetical protein